VSKVKTFKAQEQEEEEQQQQQQQVLIIYKVLIRF
jgi:hypothetical protein